jgi:hypothetical protein
MGRRLAHSLLGLSRRENRAYAVQFVIIANSVTLGGFPEILYTSQPCVTNMSRGVNGAGEAFADCNGAIATYFSRQSLFPPGMVAKTETFPRQSIVSIFCVSYSVANRSVVEAATPMGPGTVAKGLGLAIGASGVATDLGTVHVDLDWRRKRFL